MNCEQFHDHLVLWMRGDLGKEQTDALLQHTSTCADCAAVLRFEEQLALGTADALENAVPEDLLDGVWPAVAAALPHASQDRTRRRSAILHGRRAGAPVWRRALVPALAASVAVLLMVSGFLLGRLSALEKARPPLETGEVLQQTAVGGPLGDPTQPSSPGMTSPTAETSRPPALRLPRGVSSLEEIVLWLERLPADTVILSAQDAHLVMASASPGFGFLRQRRGIEIDPSDGIDAEEILGLLDTLQRTEERQAAERWLRNLTTRRTGRI